MAQRSKSHLYQTPNYGICGRPDCLTIKLHHNGDMKSGIDYKEYIGGQFEYFDYVDRDKLGMIELWGYAEDVGCLNKQCIKFWHKFGENLKDGRYLENDIDVMDIIPHIPRNYEVEIYIEKNDGVSSQTGLGSILIRMETGIGESEIHNTDGEGEYVDGFNESDYEFDELFDTFVDRDAGWSGYNDYGHISKDLLRRMQQNEGDDDCVNNDGSGSPLNSDDDDDMRNFPMFDPKTESENPELKLGLIFRSKKEAKFAIESHCIRRGMPVRFVKNDGKRLRAQCRNNDCGWVIHVSMMTNDSCWQVKTFQGEHNNCFWNLKNKSMNSTWLGKTFAQKFISNPKLGSVEFKNQVRESLNANVTMKVAYLAKRKAMSLAEGSVEEQFSKIRNYCAELKRTDRDATVILKLTGDEGRPRFQRMYVCFSVCKFGYQDACRPVIGVDGCFLKSRTGGQLLSAVGLDANNNIFPVCYALVEGETKDTWMWFLQLLAADIKLENDYAWTFMSDKQKGLIPALESLFPNAEHKFP